MQKDIFSRQFKSRKTLLTILYKHYHSKNVFGYRPKTQTKYNLPGETIEARNKQSNFYRFVTAYRQHAHKLANVNPVSLTKLPSFLPELDPERYNLSKHDIVDFPGILRTTELRGTVSEAITILENVYKNTIGVEFLHLESEEEVEWFAERVETLSQEPIDNETKIKIATELLKSQAFDNFLAIKFASLKRYGGEGAESMMAFFSEFFKISSLENIKQVVFCIPHRGRLNLLTGMLELPPGKLFRKLKGLPDFPTHFNATGDVISHLVSSVDLTIDSKEVHVTMLYNPSHLEAVNPVSMGKTRAKQMVYSDGDYGKNTKWSDKILNLQVHGDAAYAAQGVNQECLALSGAPHFEIGGSVHLIINNQLGFTTPSDRGRSSRYCSDLAKIVSAPVIHVNGDYPEDVVKATRLAMDYQRKFRKEVFVDLNCFRRWGHNELDDPTFTNPALYAIIKSRKSVPDLYAEKLVNEGILTESQIKTITEVHSKWLNDELKNVESFVPTNPCFEKQWAGKEQASATVTAWDTGINLELMMYIGNRSVTYPQDFVVHPNLVKNYIKSRLSMISTGVGINWATAEALAMGSLMYQGYNVRISGQDVGRGTFSQRHAMLVDQKTNLIHIPLNNLDIEHQGYLEVANSILSEEAVLGFEYGMSIENPNNLIIWEAQFGDFFNGAQIIIDTFITSGEAKWLTCSGLVMLLPHGYDGAGPEHSSCRLERFLQLSDSSENHPDGDDVNIQIVNPTTPAQYFHLLRRQMIRNFRKPLIIVAPKTLLRLPEATSALSDMAPGTTFLPVIDDNTVDPIKVTRILLVSGKLYFSLEEQRKALNTSNVAIVRVECLSPFPTLHLQKALDRFPNVKAFIWCQEEPQNMGAWSYMFPRFRNLLGINLQYVGRETSAAPAVGVGQWHQEQMKKIVTLPFSYNIK